MRAKILLITLMSMAFFTQNANGADYRAIYDFEYTKDSINSIIEKDILYLEISKNSSFCFSYYTYYSDSLTNTPNGWAVWRKLFSAAIAKDGTNATSFPYKRSTFMVTKRYTSDTLCIKDMIDNDVYEYIASKNEFHWQLCDSTKQSMALRHTKPFAVIMAEIGRSGSRPTYPSAMDRGCSADFLVLSLKRRIRIICFLSAW